MGTVAYSLTREIISGRAAFTAIFAEDPVVPI
jgi:hypothetical protein